MIEPGKDREFVEYCRSLVNAGCSIPINSLPRMKNLAGSYSYDNSMIDIATLRLDLAGRDKQVAELTDRAESLEIENAALDEGGARMTRERDAYSKKVAELDELVDEYGSVIATYRLAIEEFTRERDEVREKDRAAERRIAEVCKASVLAREAAVFIGMVAPITINGSDCLDEAKTKLRELSRILSALSEERET